MADADKKRKYLLFSKDDGRPDALKPCAFFLSPAGCKNGSKCKFSHGEEKKGNNERPVPVVVAAPVVEVKKEKKQKREPQYEEEYEAPVPVYVAPKVEKPVVKAPKPVPVKPQVDTKEDEISLLKAQLLKQQQMFEEVMRKATQPQVVVAPVVEKTPVKAAAPSTKAKYAKKEVAPKVAVPKVAPSSYQQQNPHVQTYAPIAAPPGFASSARAPVVAAAHPEISDYSGDSDNDDDDEDDTEFLFDAVNVALKGGRKASPVPSPAPVAAPVYQMPALVAVKPVVVKTVAAPVNNDSSLFLTAEKTVKSLQSSGTKHATHGNVKKNLFANQKTPVSTPSAAPKTPSASITRAEVFDASKVDFPRLPWTSLVHSTQAHQRYKKEYTFEVDHSWIKARPVGEWCTGKNLPWVLAIDCEMCESADPVTGAKDSNTLVRLSIVNGFKPDDVLVDTLVAPMNPITELRSHIHGISAEQLQVTNFTLRQAQAWLYNNTTENTIIVGHSVHNDLKALHFNHANVIDTAYLYQLENEPNAAASVRDISDQVLGVKLSDTHDSIMDARSALYAAAVILVSGPQKALVRTSGNVSSSAIKNAQNAGVFQLLVHRIPDFCSDEHITEMIIKYTQIVPVKVNSITRSATGGATPDATSAAAGSGKTTVQFFSQMHADLAFDSIVGPNRPDKQGRDQKRIYLKGGGYICVRK